MKAIAPASLTTEAYLSQKIEEHIYRAFNLGNSMGVFRYRWTPSHRCPEKVENKRKLAHYYFNIITQLGNLLFVYQKAWQVSHDPNATRSERVLSQFMALYWTSSCIFLLDLFAFESEMVNFVKQTMDYLKGKLF